MNESEKRLSDKHKRFIDEYFVNGLNASKAYKAIYASTNITASKKGAALLKKVEKSEYFVKKSEKKVKKSEDSYKKNIENLKEIILLATQDGKYSAAVSAINEINKMEGNHAETKIKLSGSKEEPIVHKIEVEFID